jgi:Queuine tRNA-ribosyltransferase
VLFSVSSSVGKVVLLFKKFSALKFTTLAKCSTTKARVSVMELPHASVDTPVFMPVGTQGTLKGLLPEQLEKMDCRIILGKSVEPGRYWLNLLWPFLNSGYLSHKKVT